MGLYMFGFDDGLEAKKFEKVANKLIKDYSLTTLGHLKDYYGVKTVDSDYADYVILKPRYYYNKHKNTYYEYAKSYIKPGLGEVHYFIGIKSQGLREKTFDGMINYPQYDEDGNLIEKKHYIESDHGLQMLAAAVIERAANDTTNSKGQEFWETIWCKELFFNEDIDPLKIRDQINYNRKTYGSWKVPWDLEHPNEDPRAANRSVIRPVSEKYARRRDRKREKLV